jgi:hypothetical protein
MKMKSAIRTLKIEKDNIEKRISGLTLLPIDREEREKCERIYKRELEEHQRAIQMLEE